MIIDFHAHLYPEAYMNEEAAAFMYLLEAYEEVRAR